MGIYLVDRWKLYRNVLEHSLLMSMLLSDNSTEVGGSKNRDVTKPFNIVSYALLTMMIAQVSGLKAGDFVHTLGDAHLYLNHLQQVDEQLSREPMPLPEMKINPAVNSIFDFRYEDFEVINYQAHPSIRAPIAV